MRDLVLTEAFHRQKRTLLLFSAALIVIGMAVPNATSTLKLAVIDATLSTTVARWLVWGGAFYYAVGLAMEVMVIRRLNSPAATGNQGAFELMSEKLKGEVLKHYQAVADFADKLPEADFGLSKQLEQALMLIERQPPISDLVHQIMTSTDMRLPSGLDTNLVTQTLTFNLARRGEEMQSAITGLANELGWLKQRFDWEPLSEVLVKLDAVQHRLDRAHKDMTRITSSVVIERRAAFWGWEVGAAFAAFAVATAIGLPLVSTFKPVLAWLAPVLHRWPF